MREISKFALTSNCMSLSSIWSRFSQSSVANSNWRIMIESFYIDIKWNSAVQAVAHRHSPSAPVWNNACVLASALFGLFCSAAEACLQHTQQKRIAAYPIRRHAFQTLPPQIHICKVVRRDMLLVDDAVGPSWCPHLSDRRLIARLKLCFTMPTQETSISHCATFWIDLTPGPEAPKKITNTFLQKTLPLVNHSFRKL